MVNCQHAASGCDYPASECAGACMPETFLTIVYHITHPKQPRALLEQAEWSASSHTHAIHERDQLHAELNDVQDQRRAAFRTIERLNDELGQVCDQRDELLTVLRLARANLSAELEVMAMSHHNPVTGTVDDAEVALIIEAEQDLINQIDAAIEKATGEPQ